MNCSIFRKILTLVKCGEVAVWHEHLRCAFVVAAASIALVETIISIRNVVFEIETNGVQYRADSSVVYI